VLRRDFLKLGAGFAASTLATGVPGATSGNRVGTTTVQAVRANLARLRRLDDHLGGADTFPLYEAEVERIAALIRTGTFSGTRKQDLQLLLAEHAQQTGWAAFDAGLQAKARQLFETSFEIAKDARSADLAGNALALRSYQLLSAGTLAPELTDRSLSTITADTHPAVRSLLFQRGAWTYAVAGDVQHTARSLAQATEALDAGSRERRRTRLGGVGAQPDRAGDHDRPVLGRAAPPDAGDPRVGGGARDRAGSRGYGARLPPARRSRCSAPVPGRSHSPELGKR
jgi:hypothetical protein